MDLLARLKKLAKNGNERIVILNEAGDDGFVMLPLSEYEALIGSEKSKPEPASPTPSEPEHKRVPPPQTEEIKINVKVGKPEQIAKLSQKLEDEERFYLEPLG